MIDIGSSSQASHDFLAVPEGAGDFAPLDVLDVGGKFLCAVVANLADIGLVAVRRATRQGDGFVVAPHVETIASDVVVDKVGEVTTAQIPEEQTLLVRTTRIILAQIQAHDRLAIMRWGAMGLGRVQTMFVDRGGKKLPALVLSVCNHRLLLEGKVAIAYDPNGDDDYTILFYDRGSLDPFHAIDGMPEDNLVWAIEHSLKQSRKELAAE